MLLTTQTFQFIEDMGMQGCHDPRYLLFIVFVVLSFFHPHKIPPGRGGHFHINLNGM